MVLWPYISFLQLPVITLSGHKDAVVGAAWLPTSKKDAATVSWDHNILFWDLELGGKIWFL